jgi:septation ring formation regulator EzrA
MLFEMVCGERPLPLILAQEEAVAAIEKQEEEIRNEINELKKAENQTQNKEKIDALKQRLDELSKEKVEKQVNISLLVLILSHSLSF